MAAYLTLQKNHLKPSSSVYPLAMQENNKRIFLHLDRNKETGTKERAATQMTIEYRELPSMMSAKAKLNPTELIEAIFKTNLVSGGPKLSDGNKNAKNGSEIASAGNVHSAHGQTVSNQAGANNSGGTGATGQQTDAQHYSAASLNKLASRLKTVSEAFAFIQYLSMSTNNEKAKDAVSDKRFGQVKIAQLKQSIKTIAPYTDGLRLSDENVEALVDIILGRLK
jgi:hypothetical protein